MSEVIPTYLPEVTVFQPEVFSLDSAPRRSRTSRHAVTCVECGHSVALEDSHLIDGQRVCRQRCQ
jgi:formylmethanofuran dehydrogenase subunit E